MNGGNGWLEGEDGEDECRSDLTGESGGRDEGPEGGAGSSGDLALYGTKSCIGGVMECCFKTEAN